MQLVKNIFSNRKLVVIGAVVIIAIIVAALAFGGSGSPLARAQPTATLAAIKPTQQVVSAEGTVLPVSRATLAFKTSGRVGDLPVREGATVKKGDVIAKLDVKSLEAQVNQADAAYNTARIQYDRIKVKNASDTQIASATLQKLKSGPTAQELAVAEAKAYQAYVLYAQAEDAFQRFGWIPGTAEANIRGARDQAGAANTTAQAELARVKAGVRPEDIAAAQAQLDLTLGPGQAEVRSAQAQMDQAKAALDLAKANLNDALLVAPFDGTVSLISADVGQIMNPGQQVVQLGDLSQLQVETTDLAEVDVAKVAAGQAVNVSVDAFPGKVFKGTVLRVAQAANEKSGKKVFKVVIELPDTADSGLRWGMTANVEIVIKP